MRELAKLALLLESAGIAEGSHTRDTCKELGIDFDTFKRLTSFLCPEVIACNAVQVQAHNRIFLCLGILLERTRNGHKTTAN